MHHRSALLVVALCAAHCANPTSTTPTPARDASGDLGAMKVDAAADVVDDLRAVGNDAVTAPDAPDAPSTTPSPVWTNRNDNARTGATLTETRLTTETVTPSRFGLLFSRAVEGQIYAQPLYVPGVMIPGRGPRNVVYVATEHNVVYAFDADDPAVTDPYWTANLGAPMPAEDVMADGPCHNLTPEVGVTATPVIDLAAGTIFVVAKTREDGVYAHRLHAFDLATGSPRAHSPMEISGAVRGSGNGTDKDGMVHLDPLWTHARPGLALANGVVYATFASHCDREAYHGWILAYDAATLARRAIYNPTPDGANGGIWQSGTAPSLDDRGDLYFTVGDGTATPDTSPPQLGNSVGRLRLEGSQFTTVDFFTPYDHADLFARDMDLGSTGVLLIPHTHFALVGSKEGLLYLLDRDAMGHYHAGADSQIVQRFRATHTGEARNIHGTPVYWDSPDGPRVYIWGEEDHLKAFSFDGHQLGTTPVAMSPMLAADGMPGGMLSLSANGSARGTGVLWSSMPLMGDAVDATVPGVLRAFDAADVSHELWNSEMTPRDALGDFAKFCPPTVANGRVYMATFSDRLNVYGLR